MPDHRFHTRRGPFTLRHLALVTGASVAERSDPGYEIEDVAPLETAGKKDLSFLDNPKYNLAVGQTKAGVCIIRPEHAGLAPAGTHLLLSKVPYNTFALACQAFYPEMRSPASVSARAIVHSGASIGEDCIIEDGAVIKSGAQLGSGCWIEANAVIGKDVVLGDHCRVGSGSSVSHALIGNYVRLYPGVRIGQDGFGFAPGPAGHIRIPQLGRVIIEDNVEIGANTTIDRGSGPDTVIGTGTWIDNLVQIAHNVKIGRECIIAAQTGISGSTVIEDFVSIGGQAGISGHLRIGKRARLAAKSGVTSNVPPGMDYMGYPARPMRQYLKGVALLNRLIKKEKSS